MLPTCQCRLSRYGDHRVYLSFKFLTVNLNLNSIYTVMEIMEYKKCGIIIILYKVKEARVFIKFH